MNFAALPPEINSGLMYAGPGSGPMMAATTAWEAIAAELRSTATAYESVISGLISESWLGPSSAAMAAAAGRYRAWLTATAAQAEQTATQSRAAAAAYETAFAMTVAPAVIAANRAQLAALVATNVFGQNTPAIAVTEAQYGEMWAQDAAAMYGYAGSAAMAAELTPFSSAPTTTNPAGQVGQGAATAQQVGQISALAGALPALAMPAQFIPPVIGEVSPFAAFTAVGLGAGSLSTASGSWSSAAANSRLLINNTEGILHNSEEIIATEAELGLIQSEILEILHDIRAGGFAAAASAGLGPSGIMPVSAAVGQAVSAGKLSVPLSWAVAAPEIRTVGYALPTTNVGAAPAVLPAGAGTAFSQMAMAGMAGSALAGSVSRGRQEPGGPVRGECAQVIAGEHAESSPPTPESPVAGLVVGLRDLGELRDAGLLTNREFDEQKQRLLAGPLQ